MSSRVYRRYRKLFDLIDGLFLKNTVLEKGLVVAPVVVVGTSLQNAVALALVFSLLTFFTVFVTSFVSRKIPHTLRVIIAVVFAAALYIPAAMLVDLWFPGISYQLGVFLPLLITNSLIVWRSDSRFHREKKGMMAFDLLFHILGFWVVICFVGAVREMWGSGTLWGQHLSFADNPLGGILLPFAGFIILGFLAAFLHKCRNGLIPMDKDHLPEPQDFGYQTAPDFSADRSVEEDEAAPLEGREAADA